MRRPVILSRCSGWWARRPRPTSWSGSPTAAPSDFRARGGRIRTCAGCVPTSAVPRGTIGAAMLPRAERSDLDRVTFRPTGQNDLDDVGAIARRQFHRRHPRPASQAGDRRALLWCARCHHTASGVLGDQVVCRHHCRHSGCGGRARRSRHGRQLPARTDRHRLRRCDDRAVARHDHRREAHRRLRRRQGRDLGPRSCRQLSSAARGLRGPRLVLRISPDGQEGLRARRTVRVQDGKHRRPRLGAAPRHRQDDQRPDVRLSVVEASASNTTRTSPSTPPASSLPGPG